MTFVFQNLLELIIPIHTYNRMMQQFHVDTSFLAILIMALCSCHFCNSIFRGNSCYHLRYANLKYLLGFYINS